ncbi:hypothetical protein LMG22931_05620 [Paraburkholderia nemoris]|nr:hypothetical protein LMG22931_05620 [Paraburkholderia nemoris]
MEAEMKMMDFAVQIVVVAVVLAMLLLSITALDRRPHLRKRASRSDLFRDS